MKTYDPYKAPNPEEWLELDETQHHDMVESYHELEEIELPNAQLHAVIHTVIEDQLAMGVGEAQDTLKRLIGEGLDRHDALHAIGSVLAQDIYDVLKGASADGKLEQAYLQELGKLTAEKWRGSI